MSGIALWHFDDVAEILLPWTDVDREDLQPANLRLDMIHDLPQPLAGKQRAIHRIKTIRQMVIGFRLLGDPVDDRAPAALANAETSFEISSFLESENPRLAEAL